MNANQERQIDHDYEYGKIAMSWSGWGSPVGLGIGLVSIGVFMWTLHLADLIK